MRYAIIGATVEQVVSIGAKDVREAPSTGIVFATLTPEQVEKLRAMGFTVSQVGSVRAAVMPPTPVTAAPVYSPQALIWAVGLEEARKVTTPPLYGEGINVAVIDTGIRESHQQVAGRVIYRKNYTSSLMRDGFDHGTGVTSIILAVAPRSNILNLKVLDDKGQGTEEEVIMAIDDCIGFKDSEPDLAPSVINLSLGSEDIGDPSDPLRVACRVATEQGIWVSAAAGNSGPSPGTIMSPACEKYVFATGSMKFEPLEISTFSSRGPTKEGIVKPDAVFFGEDIIVASSGGDAVTRANSGTSFSTPFNTGIAVLYHEGARIRARTIEQLLQMPPAEIYYVPIERLIDTYLPLITAKPRGAAAGKDNAYGCGLPYGPLVSQALGLRPAIDLPSIVGVTAMMLMLGMVVKATE